MSRFRATMWDQCVAAALAGLDVGTFLLGSVGDDDRRTAGRESLASAGVDASHVRTVDGGTAVKYRVVDDAGRAAILGASGANESFQADDLSADALEGLTVPGEGVGGT